MIDFRLIDADTGLVNLDRWRLRGTMGTGVGRCRCGGSIIGLDPEPEPSGRITWLPMRCHMCGHQTVQIAERRVRTSRVLQPAE